MHKVDMELASTPFCLIEAKNKYDNGQLKEHLDCKNYVSQYFYPLKTGEHAFYDVHEKRMNVMSKEQICNAYMSRLPKDIFTWYFKSAVKLSESCFNVKQGLAFDHKGTRYINTFPGFKYKNKRLPTDDEKKGIKLMWDHVKNIICSGNVQVYEFVRKWFSHVATGRKMTVALFLKSKQGAGKGTFTEFFFKDVMGMDIVFMASDPNCVIGRFNGQLKGKLMLILEEMRAMNVGEWSAVNDKLKNLITDSTTNYEDKYATATLGENHLSVVILSNNDCIKLPYDDRRYLVVDISNEKIGDIEYFDTLHHYTKHTEGFGEAFYWDCVDYAESTSEWKEYKDILNISSETKTDIVIKHMDAVYKFVKNEFLLKQKGMNIFLKDLTNAYNAKNERNKREGREISKMLRDIGIVGKSSTGNKLRYKLTYEELLTVYKQRKFTDDKDEYENEDECDVSDLITNVVNYEKEPKQNLFLKTENVRLKERIKELEEQVRSFTNPKVITTRDEIMFNFDSLKDKLFDVPEKIIIEDHKQLMEKYKGMKKERLKQQTEFKKIVRKIDNLVSRKNDNKSDMILNNADKGTTNLMLSLIL